ncbi:metallophosphoesterase [Halobellus ruber]|uniref:Metallophosphoesterase n=1 Tax=Halobellus ruber TaxID=2761102 RepID=A0A7J9SEG7_9EURY|nr:metallophosphoesterase [Halobellus ruber]MBB6644793.1 metallophosphoesterase [Halobellus ruber]
MDFDPGPAPDSIGWFKQRGELPAIVSISDIHGYLEAARNALTAVGETDEYPPVVTVDDEGHLHWADNDYVLLVNGDLLDRGDRNRACLALLERLASEAPPGRVRYHLGNHEMAVLFPDRFRWPGVYSIEMDDDLRRSFVEHVADSRLPVAFEGYEYTYSHAGANEPFDVAAANEQARDAARRLVTMLREGRYREHQLDILPDYDLVFGLGGQFGRGPSAGLLWMDLEHMKRGAPPQVVGHSRQASPTRRGNVICENVIRNNLGVPGGEAVVIERPDGIAAVTNSPSGATVTEL